MITATKSIRKQGQEQQLYSCLHAQPIDSTIMAGGTTQACQAMA